MSISKLLGAIAILSILGSVCMTGSAATFTLDDFKSGNYVVSLENANARDIHFAELAPGSPLGPARYTVFTPGPNPYAQWSSLNIGNGICILDSGFGVIPGVQIYYGWASPTRSAPLGLNLSGYAAFRVNFAGISTAAA